MRPASLYHLVHTGPPIATRTPTVTQRVRRARLHRHPQQRQATPPAPITGNAQPRPRAGRGAAAPPRCAPTADRRAYRCPPNQHRKHQAESLADRLRRVAGLLRPALSTGTSHHDPLFGQPDLVEDDYYRFRHQPRSW